MTCLSYHIKRLYDALQNHKHIWCLKSRGIGVTTFLLRYIAWCCLRIFSPNDRVCIITGPRIDLAEDLIARFKGLFSTNSVQNDRTQNKSTVAFLNGVRVECFPSHHVDTMRGLTDVKFIMSDESDMYPVFQRREVRAVMEGYIGKPNSNPTIILVSTPQAPGGLMQTIELEQPSLYHKLSFDYHYGLQGRYPIYSQELIQNARLSPESAVSMNCNI
jgi:late competence protein required for DNA uptake (superfamily II DNA/RNA helicase)